jgi:alginate O-acetyltransferase complex protein AlgI
LWGLFHGTFLVMERLGVAAWLERVPRPWRHVYVLLVVMVGWVFFRADTLPQAAAFLTAMAGWGAAEPTPYAPAYYLTPELWLALAAGVVAATPVLPAISRWRARAEAAASGPRLAWALGETAALGLLMLASVMQVAARTYNPFIYFRF